MRRDLGDHAGAVVYVGLKLPVLLVKDGINDACLVDLALFHVLGTFHVLEAARAKVIAIICFADGWISHGSDVADNIFLTALLFIVRYPCGRYFGFGHVI